MKILALDTSSQSASCAILADGKLLGEFFTNVKLTHSQTILPMTENLLTQTRESLSGIDLFAVTEGPGSFTGLRIGLSAVKGMAHTLGKRCVGISTMEALAWNLCGADCVVAPVLDARCAQVYTALFRWREGKLIRLAEDEAVPLATLEERICAVGEPVWLVGDGAELCRDTMGTRVKVCLPSAALLFPRASSVALAAVQAAEQGKLVPPETLAPAYLRLPQAERERLAREKLLEGRNGT